MNLSILLCEQLYLNQSVISYYFDLAISSMGMMPAPVVSISDDTQD
jgi:hypothetical protein